MKIATEVVIPLGVCKPFMKKVSDDDFEEWEDEDDSEDNDGAYYYCGKIEKLPYWNEMSYNRYTETSTCWRYDEYRDFDW